MSEMKTEFEYWDETIFGELDETGRVMCFVHASDACMDEEEAILDWADAVCAEVECQSEITLLIKFRLDTVLKWKAESNELGTGSGEYDVTSKPLFIAMRKELVEMIEFIDGMNFKSGEGD